MRWAGVAWLTDCLGTEGQLLSVEPRSNLAASKSEAQKIRAVDWCPAVACNLKERQ